MRELTSVGILASLVLLAAYSHCLCPVRCANDTGVEIRLTPVPSLTSEDGNVGRVEVCCNDKWGTVALEKADHFWSEKNVQVACMQLGFSGGLNSILPIHIPISERPLSTVPVHYQKIACNGEEEVMTECNKGLAHQKTHATDVYIVCRPRLHPYSRVHQAGPQDGDFRLFGSYKNGEGAVEMFTGSEWATICPDSSWINQNARILCTALGYDRGVMSQFSNALNSTPLLSDAQCSDPDLMTTPTTTEAGRVSIKYCSFSYGTCSVHNGKLAGINCSSIASSSLQSFQLFGLEQFDTMDISGVVEVFEDQRWGMVCANTSKEDPDNLARVLCRSLLNQEYPHAQVIAIPVGSLLLYESNLKPIWLDDITCPSDALAITDCIFKEPLGYGNCSYGDILAVRCGVRQVTRTDTFIIVGSILLVVVALVAVVIFLLYLRRAFTRRDRISVTSMVLNDPNSSENVNNSSNGIGVQETQPDNVKSEGTSDENFTKESVRNGNCNPNA